jgi:hypothetical protein
VVQWPIDSEPSTIASIVTPAASRIVRGALPFSSAFQITRLIAEFLHAA